METADHPAPDSGYPTPRDDNIVATTSRSSSPDDISVFDPHLTSTPSRAGVVQNQRGLCAYFSSIKEESESNIHNTSIFHPGDDLSDMINEFAKLHRQKKSMKNEILSLEEKARELEQQNKLLIEQIKNQNNPSIPALDLKKLNDDEELDRIIKNESVDKHGKMQDKQIGAKVITATAVIPLDSQKTDADVQTEQLYDDEELKNKLGELTTTLQKYETEKNELENRLFEYDKLKAQFEKNEDKLKRDLELLSMKKDDRRKFIEELNLRIENLRKQNEKIENEKAQLIEDSKVHEFEYEEMKVQLKSADEELAEFQNRITALNQQLEDEKQRNKQLEDDMKQKINYYNDKINDLMKEMESLRKESVSLRKETEECEKKLKEEFENREKLNKEREYLKSAETDLIEKNIALQDELSEVKGQRKESEELSNYYKKENEKLSEEKMKLEADIAQMVKYLEESDKEKQQSNELLVDFRNAKEEIDFLRKELESKTKENEQIEHFNTLLIAKDEEIKSLLEKLGSNQSTEEERVSKHESLIRENAAMKVELENTKGSLDEKVQELSELLEKFNEAQSELNHVRQEHQRLGIEFEDYKNNALLQFYDEVGKRDRMIEDLNTRLIQLETYPGQNISISRKNTESQTDSIEQHDESVQADLNDSLSVKLINESEIRNREDEDANSSYNRSQLHSPDQSCVGSLVSSASSRQGNVEMKLERIIEKLSEYLSKETSGSETSAQTICRNVLELINNLHSNLSSPIAQTSRFWMAINDSVRKIEKQWNDELIKNEDELYEAKKRLEKMDEELRTLRSELDGKENQLQEEISGHRAVLEEYRLFEQKFDEIQPLIEEKDAEILKLNEIAEGFKSEYEYHLRMHQEMTESLKELEAARNEERIEWEKSAEALRQRLEQAEANIQERIRQGLKDEDAADEEAQQFKQALERSTEEVGRLKKALEKTEEKRKFDKKTALLTKNWFDEAVKMNKELEQQIDEMQKALDFSLSSLKELKRKVSENIGSPKAAKTLSDYIEKVLHKGNSSVSSFNTRRRSSLKSVLRNVNAN